MKLESKFHPNSRLLVEHNSKIMEVKAKLAEEDSSVMNRVTTGLNMLYQQTKKEILLHEVNLNSLQVKRDTLLKHLDRYSKELNQLQSNDMELSRLQRQIKLEEESFLLYKRKLEESKISTLLDAEKVVNVRVVEPAIVSPVSAGSSRKQLILELGAALGLLAGIGLAFLFDTFDHSLRTPEQVHRWLGLQVLASVEKVKS